MKSILIDQDTYPMLAAAAVMKSERLDALKKEQNQLRKTKYSNIPVFQSLDEALRDTELTEAMNDVEAELKDLAIEMRDGGVPLGVWIRYPQEERRDVMLRVSDTGPPKLSINDYTGP